MATSGAYRSEARLHARWLNSSTWRSANSRASDISAISLSFARRQNALRHRLDGSGVLPVFGVSDAQQVVLDGEQRGSGARGDTHLRVDVLQVEIDRFGRNLQVRGGFLNRATDRDAPQHIHL